MPQVFIFICNMPWSEVWPVWSQTQSTWPLQTVQWVYYKLRLKIKFIPGRCGSVGWGLIWQPKVCGFNSQPGCVPRLQVPSLVWAPMMPGLGTWGRQSIDVYLSHWWFFLPSSPPSLSVKAMKKCLWVKIKKQKVHIRLQNVYYDMCLNAYKYFEK